MLQEGGIPLWKKARSIEYWAPRNFLTRSKNIRNTQLRSVSLNFPLVCENISACLQLNRPRLAIVHCYDILCEKEKTTYWVLHRKLSVFDQ